MYPARNQGLNRAGKYEERSDRGIAKRCSPSEVTFGPDQTCGKTNPLLPCLPLLCHLHPSPGGPAEGWWLRSNTPEPVSAVFWAFLLSSKRNLKWVADGELSDPVLAGFAALMDKEGSRGRQCFVSGTPISDARPAQRARSWRPCCSLHQEAALQSWDPTGQRAPVPAPVSPLRCLSLPSSLGLAVPRGLQRHGGAQGVEMGAVL